MEFQKSDYNKINSDQKRRVVVCVAKEEDDDGDVMIIVVSFPFVCFIVCACILLKCLSFYFSFMITSNHPPRRIFFCSVVKTKILPGLV